ncbi:hypothetical protein ACEPPZ_09790 [Paracoccus yeei]|jgi:hypothetical protein|uniref:hypothetical protein n=1 Tax=Paracoccus yeei TaxID=147645 RepID=UPI0028D093BD|nr:hypothetical protein [Paracoccus yeei]
MDALRSTGSIGACAAIIVAQVILPASLDLILSFALAGTAAWAGFKAGQAA